MFAIIMTANDNFSLTCTILLFVRFFYLFLGGAGERGKGKRKEKLKQIALGAEPDTRLDPMTLRL